MNRSEHLPGEHHPFLDKEPPLLIPKQLELFTAESVHIAPIREFEPLDALSELDFSLGRDVIMVDLGGNKVSVNYGVLEESEGRKNLRLIELYGPPLKSPN